jgi:aspartate/methionine/tyrosine aminotransferase
MNPVQALAGLFLQDLDVARPAPASQSETVSAWSKATGIVLEPERTVICGGVREMLAAAFSLLNGEDELWLPKDVYPVYWNLAAHCANKRAFTTLPQPDWSPVEESKERSTLLLPVPLSPLGRFPSDAETNALSGWLSGSPHRRLIIDAVYTFDFSSSRWFADRFLAKHGHQCMMLWSCSKSWLCPGTFGIGAVPPTFAPALRSHVSTPACKDFSRMKAIMEKLPNLWRLQQEAFTREWRHLLPIMRGAVGTWEPPETGYFSVVSKPFTTLLNKHRILSVPATVFGGDDDLSIITCLHDLTAHEKRFDPT